jgi:hypothetical protein
MRDTSLALVLLATGLTFAPPAVAADFKREKFDETGFVSIFDGQTLAGWHVSAKSGHSGASQHKTGGRWVVEDGAIVGNPPQITTWINGVRFMEFTDTEKRHIDTGGIALQVHGGGDTTKQFVRYRHIRVKVLDYSSLR